MSKYFEIKHLKNGRNVIQFILPEIYQLIKNDLGFRYAQLNKEKTYIRKENDKYKVADFFAIQTAFKEYMRNNFSQIQSELDGVSFEDFMDAYYSQPLKETTKLKSILSQNIELTNENKHQLLMGTDVQYKHTYELDMMKLFLSNNLFIGTIDEMGNFGRKGHPIFYKEITKSQYLVFQYVNADYKDHQAIFDLLFLKAKTKNDFLKKRFEDTRTIISGFCLDRDMELYKNEILKAYES